jgi:thiamine biosynthesis lipoprotein
MGIRSPNDTNSVACEFTIDGTAYVSTSGGYERYMEIDGVTYSHILDLNTGYPSTTDLASVTVYTDNGLLSDFLSTYIYLDGTDNISKYLHSDDYKVIAIDINNHIYTSDGISINVLDNAFDNI